MLNEDGTQETPEQENVRLQAAKRIEDAKLEADRLSQLAERPKTPDEWVHRQFPGQPRYAITPPNTYEVDSFVTNYRHADDPYHCKELDDAWVEAVVVQNGKWQASKGQPAAIAAAPIVLTPIPSGATPAGPTFGVQPPPMPVASTEPRVTMVVTPEMVQQKAADWARIQQQFAPPVAPPVTPPAATIPSTTATHVPLSALFDVITFAEAHPEAVSAVVGLFKGLFGHGKAA